MSKAILIMGESGSGKTTSLRDLPPDSTYYIDVDGKGLSWKGWRNSFNREKKNYQVVMKGEDIINALNALNQKEEIKYIVIDTINSMMLAAEMDNAKEKGYGKWTDLAVDGYKVVRLASMLRDDQTVIVLGHSETIITEDGYKQTRLKTNGRKLEKIVLESLFTTVLLTDYVNGEYVFITKGENITAKTPMGMFEDEQIPNNIIPVLKKMEEF